MCRVFCCADPGLHLWFLGVRWPHPWAAHRRHTLHRRDGARLLCASRGRAQRRAVLVGGAPDWIGSWSMGFMHASWSARHACSLQSSGSTTARAPCMHGVAHCACADVGACSPVQVFMTFLLVMTVYAAAVAKPGHGNTAPLAIGLSLYAAALTGASRQARQHVCGLAASRWGCC